MSEKTETSAERTGHTPGPWRTGQDGSFGISIWSEATDDEQHVADVKGHVQRSERYANACLIAAAPDLLQSLKLYMAAVDQMNAAMKDGVNVHGAVGALVAAEDMATHAIVCAEGRS